MAALTIQEMQAQLYDEVALDLTPEEQAAVHAAKAEIRAVLERYGEAGQIALSLCAADFAAE